MTTEKNMTTKKKNYRIPLKEAKQQCVAQGKFIGELRAALDKTREKCSKLEEENARLLQVTKCLNDCINELRTTHWLMGTLFNKYER